MYTVVAAVCPSLSSPSPSLSSSLSLSPPFSCCQLCRYCMGHGPSCYRAFLVQFSAHWCARRWINPWRCAHTGIETVLRLGWPSPSPPPSPPLGRLVLVWLQALPHWARLTVPCPRFLTILFCVSRMGPWTAWRPPRNPPSHAVAQFRCGDMQCLTVRSSFAVGEKKACVPITRPPASQNTPSCMARLQRRRGSRSRVLRS